ncbi:regulatory protein GemA [Nitrospirillum viridazoti]|uniref:Uncharacterized protein DUF1018 n=1 Tax=Nitrospirillum amazonense TaxID=28077 RepID=A0A560II63_9PROT|nr:regulatory protein GemA [Nitrospirillum amazonense]TWB58707.1 uncharacterized protein DUF1018 [Nitrospirillum amazonense]
MANDYAIFFALARQAGIDLGDQQAFRDYQEKHTGVRSLKAMSPAQRDRLLSALRRDSGQARGVDYRPQAGKLRALWHALWNLGIVQDRHDKALAAFVCRHTQMKALRWNTEEDLQRATECLKAWCKRVGYEPKPCQSAPPPFPPSPCAGLYEPGLIKAQWARLQRSGAMTTGIHANLETWMRNQGWWVSAPYFLEPWQAVTAVATLGTWLRRVARDHPMEGADVGDQ